MFAKFRVDARNILVKVRNLYGRIGKFIISKFKKKQKHIFHKLNLNTYIRNPIPDISLSA